MNQCQATKCTYCCEHTNMLLTSEDISRIEALGHHTITFTKQGNLGTQLKNIHGHCIFLRAGQCRIYDARPTGCRLYPIVYDRSLGEAILDDSCPRHKEFTLTIESKRQLKQLIITLFPKGL
jgi:uncharacterized protein